MRILEGFLWTIWTMRSVWQNLDSGSTTFNFLLKSFRYQTFHFLIEMHFIFSPSMCSPTTILSKQTTSTPILLPFLAFGARIRSWNWDVLCRVQTKQQGTGVRVFLNSIPPSKPLSSSLLFFVNSSSLLVTYRAPLSSFVNEKSFIFSSLRFCLPRWQKYSIISKKTLFWRVLGSPKIKTPHSYSFRRSFSKMAGLCSTFAKPCSFKSTHFARNTLFTSANSGSCIMSAPFVLKCLLSPNRQEVMELFEYGLPSLFFQAFAYFCSSRTAWLGWLGFEFFMLSLFNWTKDFV